MALPDGCHESCVTCNGPTSEDCTSCAVGRFYDGAECQLCDGCGEGEFTVEACAMNSNTVCQACSSCGEGEYEAAACSGTADAVCSACHNSCDTCSGPSEMECLSCSAGSFLDGNGACQSCGVCAVVLLLLRL